MNLLDFLDIDNVALVIFFYPMSWVELFGTLFNLWSVWLAAKNNILTWPIGLVGVVLFLILFYQIRLYSDTLEQMYYLIISFYGWWKWSLSPKSGSQHSPDPVRFSSTRGLIVGIGITILCSLVLGILMRQMHLWLPSVFTEAASYPFLDALTTIMSFVATWLMAQRRTECWFYWIIVDIIGIGLYFVKGVWLISLLYVIFLILASNGLWVWLKLQKETSLKNNPSASSVLAPTEF